MARVSANEKEAIRRRLIEAGKAEFATRGLAGARFDEISVAAGHAKGTIYNYFPNKEALFFEIVGEWCSLIVDAIDDVGASTAREQLLVIARLDIEIARKDPDLARVVVQQMPALFASHQHAVLSSIGPGLDPLIATIEEGLRSGEFVSELTSASVARLFLATLSTLEAEALTPDPVIALDDVADLVDRHFLAGLVAP